MDHQYNNIINCKNINDTMYIFTTHIISQLISPIHFIPSHGSDVRSSRAFTAPWKPPWAPPRWPRPRRSRPWTRRARPTDAWRWPRASVAETFPMGKSWESGENYGKLWKNRKKLGGNCGDSGNSKDFDGGFLMGRVRILWKLDGKLRNLWGKLWKTKQLMWNKHWLYS